MTSAGREAIEQNLPLQQVGKPTAAAAAAGGQAVGIEPLVDADPHRE